MSGLHTPGPWHWVGEDYRGDWGWQLLAGPNGEGLLCGSNGKHPYANLRAFMDLDPELCKTGAYASEKSAPAVHVRRANARLIAAAPDLLAACEAALDELAGYEDVEDGPDGSRPNRAMHAANLLREAVERATGGAS